MSEWKCVQSGAGMDECEEDYSSYSSSYPAVPGEAYYGRGPLQISHNYNYGAFGMEYLEDPDRVLDDDATAFKSALWFWTTAQNGKPSMHSVATQDDFNFGELTNIINGGIECGPDGNSTKAENREGFYQSLRTKFGFTRTEINGCADLTPYH